MRILHYALGFPPYRSGGLTEYVIDLAREEVKQGNSVGLMWPGRMTGNHKAAIKKTSDGAGIISYELVNPLPVPLLNGILDIDLFSGHYDRAFFDEFLSNLHPDVIHFHTLMGLPPEFVQAASDMKIRTVFTTHDYFGLCAKTNFIYQEDNCSNWSNCKDCFRCNQTALSFRTICAMQSPLYRTVKGLPFMHILKDKKKHSIQEEDKIQSEKISNDISEKYAQAYKNLRDFYVRMLLQMDVIHFNSNLSKQIYLHFFQPKNSAVIPVLHANIKDRRASKQFGDCLRIAYLGPAGAYKGYYMLLQALDQIYADGFTNMELHLYNQSSDVRPYVVHHPPFLPPELPDILSNIDLLVVPSLWYETYGFAVPEALSCGVPVLATSHVGAQDLIEQGGGMIVEPELKELTDAILSVYKDRSLLLRFNQAIFTDKTMSFHFSDHVKKIMELYEKG